MLTPVIVSGLGTTGANTVGGTLVNLQVIPGADPGVGLPQPEAQSIPGAGVAAILHGGVWVDADTVAIDGAGSIELTFGGGVAVFDTVAIAVGCGGLASELGMHIQGAYETLLA